MKKLLLGTSVLAAVAFAAAAQAETPKITVGGTSDFQIGHVADDVADSNRDKAFRSDNEISFKVDGKSSAGLGYGGEIVLEADTTEDSDSQGTNAARTSIYLDGGWGKVVAGSTTGVTTMKVDAASIARATGGIDGDWTYFTSTVAGMDYIATPDLVLDYGGVSNDFGNESMENLNKISYYSPKFSGFQAGLTYVPDMENRGQGASGLDFTKNAAQAGNIWQAAVAYEGKFDQVGVAAAGVYEAGTAQLSALEDLRAWNVGAKLTYMGFALAGSYGDLGDSLRSLNGNLDENNYYTVGGSYEMGPYGVSVTFLDSDYAQTSTTSNEFKNLSIGADYKLAPGLTPYAEISMFDADGVAAADNDGHVFLVGTMLNF
jgi:hypothetical protein